MLKYHTVKITVKISSVLSTSASNLIDKDRRNGGILTFVRNDISAYIMKSYTDGAESYTDRTQHQLQI